jgi:hypothetical protein
MDVRVHSVLTVGVGFDECLKENPTHLLRASLQGNQIKSRQIAEGVGQIAFL